MSGENRIGLLLGLAFVIAAGVMFLGDMPLPGEEGDSVAVLAPAAGSSSFMDEPLANLETVADSSLSPATRKLLEGLKSASASKRCASAAALGCCQDLAGDAQVLAELKRAAKDSDVAVRTEAAIALARLASEDSHGPTVVKMLGQTQWCREDLYVHVAYLACQDADYARHLLPGLNSAVEDERQLARDLVADLPEEASDVFWKMALEDEDMGNEFAAIHALVLMDVGAMPLLEDELDGSNSDLAQQILERMANDGERRSIADWKDWIEDQLDAAQDPGEDMSSDGPIMA